MIVRTEHRTAYVVIQRKTAQDDRLSLAARGLMLYLLSLPDDWVVRTSQLAQKHETSEYAIRKILNELRSAGYAELRQLRSDDDKFASGSEWIIFESADISDIAKVEMSDTSLHIRDDESLKFRKSEVQNIDILHNKDLIHNKDSIQANAIDSEDDSLDAVAELQKHVDKTIPIFYASLIRANVKDLKLWQAVIFEFTASGWNIALVPNLVEAYKKRVEQTAMTQNTSPDAADESRHSVDNWFTE